MKILLVSTQDYIHHPIPSRHHYIFEELAERHEVHVAHFHVSRGETRPTRLIVEEATQFPLQSPLFHYTLNTPYHYLVFNNLLRDKGFDAVVAAHVLAGSAVIRAAKRYEVPLVFDLKDWFPDSAAAYFKNRLMQGLVRRTVWEITKRNLADSDRITTVSPSLVEKLGRLGFTAGLITNGVDTGLFRPMSGDTARAELGIGADEFVIGFSGSVERWYAIDNMIRALPELIRCHPRTRLLVIGGSLFTDYRHELENLARDLGVTDRVIFTGTKPYHELPRYIACMDVCTIPLSPPQWGDIALPNKFFEYSACGKPIVMRPIPDVARIGGPNLFVYKTQEEYIAQIRSLMKNPRTFSINLEKYSWKEKACQFEDLLQSLV
ncbi:MULTISPECIES: glycosyltransferase [unclassified Methanoregula]|uniref:glycosyltransferase n=1 Tax=unclassified Methanoregula TaxID=2649730 RepID=UPI0009C492CD|nr:MULTISPECIES: glycosyltransferase [unclassified Methanoregula]OPX61706.1 MAG: putative glycosyl transferase [Methanoregula sp. PtaB.Bin085]OPY33985.1 MAG: putative glycosyl transferase [Methanoregula sp. PtaU1.Bin006]